MDEIMVFSNDHFGKIRVVTKEGDPWFVAKDVAVCLEYRDAANMIRALNDEEKGTHTVQTPGGSQQLSVISESGLYSCVLRSRKPEAKKFKIWIDQEVIPVIHSQKHTVPAVPVEISNTNSGIQSFENTQFGKIRVIMKDGNPWFITKDVCECLGIHKYRDAISNLYDFEKASTNSGHVEERRELSIISESGFYKLVLKSRKPEARKFQDWVTQEVLPSIRKTGSYSVDDSKNQILTAIEMLTSEIKEIKEQVKIAKPKIEFYDNFVDPESSTDMNDSAKLIGNIGRNRLFKKLREKGLLMTNNRPYQRYVTSGMFKVKGGERFIPTTYVTPKGLQVIKKMLDEEEEEE